MVPNPTQATWQEIDGVAVLRIANEPVAALPATGRRNSARFVAFNIDTREEVAQLTRGEVHSWLFRVARHRAQEIAARPARKATEKAEKAERASRTRAKTAMPAAVQGCFEF